MAETPTPAALAEKLAALMAKATPGGKPGKEAEASHAMSVLLMENRHAILAALSAAPPAAAPTREQVREIQEAIRVADYRGKSFERIETALRNAGLLKE